MEGYNVYRPCSSGSRHSDKYTKAQLHALARASGLDNRGMTIDDMCDYFNRSNSVGRQFAPVPRERVVDVKRKVRKGTEDFYTRDRRFDDLAMRLSMGTAPSSLSVSERERQHLMKKLQKAMENPRIMSAVTPFIR